MEEIRKRIGVCPQFDILWDDLTAYEHLKMFGQIKQVENLEVQIDKILSEFQLSKNKHGQVKTFSGGMKRRISLAISFMGDSEVIIMDEPTTGMDPKVRKLTWNLIKELKRNRSIILTTHNME
jgi:ABC-type multidrug transport system ATPase subunit